LVFSLSSSCLSGRDVAPVVLYGGPSRPADEISVIRIVDKNYPTIRILTLSRVGVSMETLYPTQGGEGAWAPPDHFGGLQATQRMTPDVDVQDLPSEFHVPPGTYRVEFTYMPTVDRWGWTHKPAGESKTWLECEAGHIYLLEGRMETVESGWSLVKLVLVPGEG
jgi:hypothetical protein